MKIVEKNKQAKICITGQNGIGKSAFIKNVVNEIFQKDIFLDGVLYISIKSCNSFENLVDKLFITVLHSVIDKESKDKLRAHSDSKMSTKYYECLSIIKDLKILIVIDDCNNMMLKELSNFRGFIQDLIQKIQHA